MRLTEAEGVVSPASWNDFEENVGLGGRCSFESCSKGRRGTGRISLGASAAAICRGADKRDRCVVETQCLMSCDLGAHEARCWVMLIMRGAATKGSQPLRLKYWRVPARNEVAAGVWSRQGVS